MKTTKAQRAVKGPRAGTQCLVIDGKSTLRGQIVTTLSDPFRIEKGARVDGGLKPGDVVNDIEICKDGEWVICAISHLLIPIPPPAKAARMFGEKTVTA